MLLNYHIGRLVLSSLCVGALVRLVLVVFVLQAEAQLQPAKRTENKTIDVVIQQHSRKLLKMDILALMSETC